MFKWESECFKVWKDFYGERIPVAYYFSEVHAKEHEKALRIKWKLSETSEDVGVSPIKVKGYYDDTI